MRLFLTLAAMAALMACAQRDAGTLSSTVEIPSRIHLEGHGVFMEMESTGGSRGVIAHELPVSADVVWSVIGRAFEEVGLRGAGVLDSERRIYGYPDAVIPRRLGDSRLSSFFSCGQSPGGANADVYRVVGTIVAAVRPGSQPGRSVVEMTVEAVASPREVSGGTVRCSSNGRLERLISYTALRHAIDVL
jgi:hypothetical protein